MKKSLFPPFHQALEPIEKDKIDYKTFDKSLVFKMNSFSFVNEFNIDVLDFFGGFNYCSVDVGYTSDVDKIFENNINLIEVYL